VPPHYAVLQEHALVRYDELSAGPAEESKDKPNGRDEHKDRAPTSDSGQSQESTDEDGA
jgi:hypothetical protein